MHRDTRGRIRIEILPDLSAFRRDLFVLSFYTFVFLMATVIGLITLKTKSSSDERELGFLAFTGALATLLTIGLCVRVTNRSRPLLIVISSRTIWLHNPQTLLSRQLFLLRSRLRRFTLHLPPTPSLAPMQEHRLTLDVKFERRRTIAEHLTASDAEELMNALATALSLEREGSILQKKEK